MTLTRRLAVVLLLASCAAPERRAELPAALAPAPPQTGFLDRTVDSGGVVYRYQVYVPHGWSAAKKWPVILFLHGSGESGEDGLLQTEVGLPSAIRRTPDRFPAVVVMPQCRKRAWWNHPAMMDQALAALDRATKEWNGDPKRTVLTGLSMGGYGIWAIADRFPGRFAAYAPICGGISSRPMRSSMAVPFPGQGTPDPFAAVAAKVGRTPVWVFHGAKDPAVSVEESRRIVEALKAAGADVRYTEYPEAGHDSWTATYRDPEVAAWLLAKALP